MLTTKGFAALIGVTSVWVRRVVAETGTYHGIKPIRAQDTPTGAYLWSEDDAKSYLAGKKFNEVKK